MRHGLIIIIVIGIFLINGFPAATTADVPESQSNMESQLNKEPAPDADTHGLPPTQPDDTRLSTLGQVYVRSFILEGNSVFSDDALSQLIHTYEDRTLTAEQLQEIARILTRFYIDKGYVNSGVILPDQQIVHGSVKLEIVEGTLSGMHIHGNQHLQDAYIQNRLMPARDIQNVPLNIFILQQRLKLLEQDPRIKTIQAILSPGLQRGKAALNVKVQEKRPYQVSFKVNNHGSPSVGGYGLEGRVVHYNLTGWGDTISAQYEMNEGLDEYALDYTFPITRHNTTIAVDYSRIESVVVEEPFGTLNIRGDTRTTGLSLRHPFYKTVFTEFAMALTIENRHSKTSLLKEPFSFTSGAVNGESEVTVMRFSQEWVNRNMNRVLAIRSILNFGIDFLDPTVHETLPDSRFFAAMFQLQWINRVRLFDSQVLFGLNMQLADQSLISMEKFAIGGFSSVRGYRENYLTTDSGYVSSLEWRIPVGTLKIPRFSRMQGDGVVQLVLFGDYGKGWNQDDAVPDPDDISSVGLGIRWIVSQKLYGEFYWGKALRDPRRTTDYDLQDDGIHFQISADLF